MGAAKGYNAGYGKDDEIDEKHMKSEGYTEITGVMVITPVMGVLSCLFRLHFQSLGQGWLRDTQHAGRNGLIVVAAGQRLSNQQLGRLAKGGQPLAAEKRISPFSVLRCRQVPAPAPMAAMKLSMDSTPLVCRLTAS